MNKPFKIAIYSGTVPSTTFIERLIGGLAENGNKIFLFGFQNKKQSAIKNIYYYTYTHKLSKLFQLIKYSFLLAAFNAQDKKRLDEFIKTRDKNAQLLKVKYYPVLYHRPDVFHLQWAKGLEDWIWVQLFGIKIILSLRGTHITISPIGNEALSKMYSQLFIKVDGFHSVSNVISKVAQHYGAEAQKIKTIYSGLPLKELVFKPKSNKGKILKIISIGRPHWTKGYSLALDVMALLKNDHIKFHYTIVGVATDEELLFQRNQLGLNQEVTFLETLPFEELAKLYQTSNILLLPSIEEGIANVVLEAMAFGTLVVSTDCGGMREVINTGINGFLTPIRRPKEMANIIQKVSKLSVEEYQNITKKARITIEKQHSEMKMVTNMLLLYKNVLNKAL